MKPNPDSLRDLDQRLSSLEFGTDKLQQPEAGWLRAVRDSIGVSQRDAAALAGVTQQAFDQFESGELRGSITLERLQKAATALGCEVVYFLKPAGKAGETFAALAERRPGQRKPAAKPEWANERRDDELPVNLL